MIVNIGRQRKIDFVLIEYQLALIRQKLGKEEVFTLREDASRYNLDHLV